MANTEYLVDAYVTLANVPSVTAFPVGTWIFHGYHYVNNSAGDARVVYRVYKRTTGGVETEIFNVTTEEINATTVQEYITKYTVANSVAMDITDRVVVKVYVKNTVAGRIVHFVYEGNISVSYATTSLFIAPPSGTSGYSGYPGTSGYSGYSGIGASGYSGYSGAIGSQGIQGIQGVSGYSGQQGTQGIQGTMVS